MPGYNTISWFEIGTDDPATAERFYGDLFGWTVAQDPAASGDPAYRVVTTSPDGMRGGLFDTAGRFPDYAVFSVLVEDVAAACAKAEEAGGKVQRAPQTNPAGVTFAHLLDPTGNHFEVFSPPSASAQG
jgi:predicted enzyme related to lactoylglutathione lyase